MTNISKFSQKQKFFFAVLANLMIPLGGMSTDIYLPSLPAIGLHFHITKDLVQLTVTAFVLAMGLGQLIAGPISDAFGRKRLLLLATFTQIIAVIAILNSPSIDWIIFFRFIQGLGTAFMVVPARAIINDLFARDALKKQFNYLSISFGLGLTVAPFIGGYLQHYFGWQSTFYFILLYLIILTAFLSFMYRETIAETRPFSLNFLWKNYQLILSNKTFVMVAVFTGMIWGYTALFNVIGPFLVQSTLHQSAITYGHAALFMGIAWFIGTTTNRLFFHVDNKVKTKIALWLTFLSAVIMLVLTYSGYFNVAILVIPTVIIIMCSGVMFALYIGEGLTLFPTMAASANACLFSLIWIVFSVFTAIGVMLKVQSGLSLASIFVCVSILCLAFYYSSSSYCEVTAT